MAEDASGLISTGGLAAEVGVPISTVKLWARQGVLPEPITIRGSGRRAWRLADLPEIQRRVEARRARRETRAATAA